MKRLATLAALVVLSLIVNTANFSPAADDAVKPVVAEKPEPAGKGHLLRYKFSVNQAVHYRVQHKSTIRMVSGGRSGTAENESETQKHYTSIAVDGQGNAILEPIIDWVKMSAQFDEQPKKSYDSRSDKTPDRRFFGVAKTVGKPLVRLKLTSNGKLLKAVPLIDKKTQKAVTKNAGPPKPANDASKNFLVVFPEKPVRVGESWTDDSLKVSLQVHRSPRLWQEFTILRKYDLISVKDNLATIELNMATKRVVNNPGLQVQLAERLISGTIVFDMRRGAIASRRMVVDRKIIGWAGAQSILHVKSLRTERLLTREEVAKAKAATTKN